MVYTKAHFEPWNSGVFPFAIQGRYITQSVELESLLHFPFSNHLSNLSICLPTFLPNNMPADTATRGLIIGLKAMGKSYGEIAERTELPRSTIQKIYETAVKRGFDPQKQPLEICDAHVAVTTRIRGPKKPKTDVLNETPAGEKYVLVGEEKNLVLIWLASTGPKTSMLKPLTTFYLGNQ